MVSPIPHGTGRGSVRRLGPSSGACEGFAWVFEWVFACLFDSLFGIKIRESRRIPHDVRHRERSFLPTSLRPIKGVS